MKLLIVVGHKQWQIITEFLAVDVDTKVMWQDNYISFLNTSKMTFVHSQISWQKSKTPCTLPLSRGTKSLTYKESVKKQIAKEQLFHTAVKSNIKHVSTLGEFTEGFSLWRMKEDNVSGTYLSFCVCVGVGGGGTM